MMKHYGPRGILLFLFCLLLVGCGESQTSDSIGKIEAQILWDADETDLAKALIPFVLDPPDGSAAESLPIRWAEDGYPHLSDNDDYDSVTVEDDGFTISFKIERELDSDAEWNTSLSGWVLGGHHFHKSGRDYWRTVRCYGLKGDTNFEERRVFAIGFATSNDRWFAVSLHVFDSPPQKKTVGDLLALLRKHYPTYQRLCRDVEKHIYSE